MEWIEAIVKIVFVILGTIVTVYVVPWLKEKRLYDTVKKMVDAAEKWAENNNIDKKEWVISQLEGKGIEVNQYVDALIEAAVKELDIAISNSANSTEE